MSSTGSLPTHLVELRTGSPSGMQYILIEEGNTSDCSGPDSSHHGHGYDRDKSDDGSDNGGAGEHEPLHHEDVPHAVPTVTASPSIAEPQPAPQQWKIFQPPPSVQDVVEALKDLDALLTPRKPSGGRSTKTFSGTDALRERLQQMQLFFVIFTTESLTWTKASVQAAKLSRASPGRALPVTRKTTWNSSALENEDLRRAVTDHLITLGPHIRALDIVEFLADKAVQTKFGLKKGICLSTAQGWMHKLGYRWKPIPNGQYVDGHEQADVVKYRQEVYIPALEKLRLSLREYNEDGTEYVPIGPKPFETPKPTAVHFHDESTFYANDRRKTRWVHGLEGAVPRTKGEGASLMISDFYSAEFGWLRSPTNPNRAARRLFKAGKNRDGYFTHEDVINQAMEAAAIVKDAWPEYNHVFVFDNAPTHMKRPDDSLLARNMPKGPSDTSKKTKTGYRQNFGVDRTLRRTDGTVVYAEKDGKILKERVNMVGAQFTDGSPQSLYFPSDYPVTELCGKFKGMAVILQERGYTYANRLPAECPDNFKCPKPPLDYPNDDSEGFYTRSMRMARAYEKGLNGQQAAWAAKKI
ncbi:hypothetical protein EUX98_g6488 [Antrodiella citrinella]|uniref:Uncharacterized protein n=1 Tax=Antrodiella citrinella TaxID=2447956 RepID=A0A4S4MQY7_9APHY|nr:hypothetical protein EUX98_g6488 [Antrodiella citrinella]